MGLWKISYVSDIVSPGEIGETDLLAICVESEGGNARAGITGIVTFHDGRFAQVLEGPEWQVRKLMRRIGSDPRHRAVRIISNGPIETRRYPASTMAYRDPDTFMNLELEGVANEARLLSEAFRTMPDQ